MIHKGKTFLGALLVLAILAGCSVHSGRTTPEIQLPAEVSGPPAPTVQTGAPVSDDPSIHAPANPSLEIQPSETPTSTSTSTPTPAVEPATSQPAVIPVESVTLDHADMALLRNDRARLNATIRPANATDRTLTWHSDDTSVVLVSGDGTILAVNAGGAAVTCAAGGQTASCQVTVTVPVAGVVVASKRPLYQVGEICAFEVRVYPEDASDKSYTVSLSGADASLRDNDKVYLASDGTVTVTVTAANGRSDQLSLTVVDPRALADEVFRLTNMERANAGLPAFTTSPGLTAAAMVRAAECEDLFDHTRPDGRDCFSAFDESGVAYHTAGENIAYGYTMPVAVVQGWMESPGHRANILNDGFGRLGAGVYMDKDGVLYWSQSFTD